MSRLSSLTAARQALHHTSSLVATEGLLGTKNCARLQGRKMGVGRGRGEAGAGAGRGLLYLPVLPGPASDRRLLLLRIGRICPRAFPTHRGAWESPSLCCSGQDLRTREPESGYQCEFQSAGVATGHRDLRWHRDRNRLVLEAFPPFYPDLRLGFPLIWRKAAV